MPGPSQIIAVASPTSDPLGDLHKVPLEVREEKYALVLSLNEDNYPSQPIFDYDSTNSDADSEYNSDTYSDFKSDADSVRDSDPVTNALSILFTSKTIYHEAIKFLARVNDFAIDIDRPEPIERLRWTPDLVIYGSMFWTGQKTFSTDQRRVFVEKGFMKEIRYLTLKIGFGKSPVLPEDLKEPSSSQLVCTDDQATVGLPLQHTLRSVIESLKGSSLRSLGLRMPCHETKRCHVKSLLEILTTFRSVKKLQTRSVNYQHICVSSEYRDFMADTMKLPWGAKGLVWDPKPKRGVERKRIEETEECEERTGVVEGTTDDAAKASRTRGNRSEHEVEGSEL